VIAVEACAMSWFAFVRKTCSRRLSIPAAVLTFMGVLRIAPDLNPRLFYAVMGWYTSASAQRSSSHGDVRGCAVGERSRLGVDSTIAQRDVPMPTQPAVVHSDPDILGGTAVFVGTRVPVQAFIDYLEGGHSLDEFLEDFPSVTRIQAVAALELAKDALLRTAG
jgi:uncharacterized protein (DUF433 family)